MVDAAVFRALTYDPAVAGDPALTSMLSDDPIDAAAYAHARTAAPYAVQALLAGSGPGRGTAAATLRSWLRTGVLVAARTPALYHYEAREPDAAVPQRGLLAAVAVDDATVAPHEDVDPARVADRVDRLAAVPVDVTPITALVRDAGAVFAQATSTPSGAPLLGVTDAAGVEHRVWREGDEVATRRVLAELSDVRAVIADGHHRWAAARAHAHQRTGLSRHTARTLMWLVDADDGGMRVDAIHRSLTTWPTDADARLAEEWDVTPAPLDATGLVTATSAAGPGAIGLARCGSAAVLSPRRPARVVALLGGEPLARVGAVVAERVLAGDLGLDPAALVPAPDLTAAIAEVQARGRGAVLACPPIDPLVLHTLASSTRRLVTKATSVHPKPLAGLVLYATDPDVLSRVDATDGNER